LYYKQVLPKVIWEERIIVAQLCNKVPTGFSGTPKFILKTVLTLTILTERNVLIIETRSSAHAEGGATRHKYKRY